MNLHFNNSKKSFKKEKPVKKTLYFSNQLSVFNNTKTKEIMHNLVMVIKQELFLRDLSFLFAESKLDSKIKNIQSVTEEEQLKIIQSVTEEKQFKIIQSVTEEEQLEIYSEAYKQLLEINDKLFKIHNLLNEIVEIEEYSNKFIKVQLLYELLNLVNCKINTERRNNIEVLVEDKREEILEIRKRLHSQIRDTNERISSILDYQDYYNFNANYITFL